MPFDMFAMAAMTDEVNERAAGGQVQRIVQSGPASVGLGVYAHGEQHWLLLSADARCARVSLAPERLAKAFPTPSPFIMLLRKHLEGRRLSRADQMPGERVLTMPIGGDEPIRLVAEIMGKHSNILLVDANERILGALKVVPPRQSRVRPVLPGQAYQPPPRRDRDSEVFPPGPRLDPAVDPEAALSILQSAPGDTPVRGALLGLLLGASPFLADQIAYRAGVEPESPVDAIALDRVVAEAAELYHLLGDRQWQPSTFIDIRARLDFAPYAPLKMRETTRTGRMSEAVEQVLGGAENRDPLSAPRSTLVREVERARRAAERRVTSMREGLQASAEAGEARTRGQLILAYSHAIEPGAAILSIPDMGMEIPLDPALPPQGNAERAFRRYTKLRDAAVRLPGLIAEAEQEAARLADLEVFARLADTEGALRDLQREIAGDRGERPARKPAKRGPLRYRRGTFEAMVGRNARENEEVTFRLAGKDDLWLHARERTGAHVVLRQGLSAPDEVVAAAAALAGYYSESRSDSRVPVDIAPPRTVRKIPGGPPGRVSYRNERTLVVEPTMDGWEQERR
jgi:predicted ribosome quality control (RQC) complex YloA/Tae2 family protein